MVWVASSVLLSCSSSIMIIKNHTVGAPWRIRGDLFTNQTNIYPTILEEQTNIQWLTSIWRTLTCICHLSDSVTKSEPLPHMTRWQSVMLTSRTTLFVCISTEFGMFYLSNIKPFTALQRYSTMWQYKRCYLCSRYVLQWPVKCYHTSRRHTCGHTERNWTVPISRPGNNALVVKQASQYNTILAYVRRRIFTIPRQNHIMA